MFGDPLAVFPSPDDSDDECESTTTPLSWKTEIKLPEKIDNFVIFEFKSSVDFAKQCIIKPCDELTKMEGADITLYQIHDTNIIVCTSLCGDHKLFGEASFLLHPWLEKAERVLGIQSTALAYFIKTDNPPRSDIIRSLSNHSVTSIPPLDSPNIITGIAAGAYNYCDFFEKPIHVFICFSETDIYGFGGNHAKLLSKLLHSFKVPQFKTFVCRPITSTTYL